MNGRRKTAVRLLALASLAALAGGAPGAARGQDERDALNRIDFQVEASREVANDRARAVLAVEGEDVDPAALADRINQTMAWALEKARAAEGVEVRTGGYRTYPVHEQGRIRRWRSQQELVLESAEPENLTALVGELQSRLALRAFDFEVSPELRRRTEDELVREVLAGFRARAEIVRNSLEASGYAIVRISVETSGGRPPVRPFAESMRAATVQGVAPPSVEGGTTELVVRAQGTIELD